MIPLEHEISVELSRLSQVSTVHGHKINHRVLDKDIVILINSNIINK